MDPNPDSAKWTVYLNWDQAVESSKTLRSYTVRRPLGSVAPDPVSFSVNFTYATPGTFAVSMAAKETTTGETNDNPFSPIGYFSAVIASNNVPPTFGGVNTGPVFLGEGSSLDLPDQTFVDPDDTDNFQGTVTWGDGTSSNLMIAGHTYHLMHQYLKSSPEPYVVTVFIHDGTATVQTSFTVTVENVAPTVNAGPGGMISEGGTFTGNGFFVDPGADTWTATVDYGDGSGVQPLAFTMDKSFGLSHLYDDNGSYPVTVTVADDSGGVDSSTATVTVQNIVPMVGIIGNTIVNEGDGYLLNVGVVNDPGMDTISLCTVDWGDGASSACIPDEGIVHTYVDGGNAYTIRMDLADEDGSYPAVASQGVTVNNVAPTVTLRADHVLFENDTFQLDPSSFTDPGILDTHTALIDWGDTTSEPGVVDPNVRTVSGSHLYDTPGRYMVTVTVEDKDSASGSDTVLVTVLQGIFKACVSADQLGGDLKIEEAANVNCSVHGEGKVTLKKDTVIGGDVTARNKDIKLEKDATVSGDVATDDKVEIKENANVQGDVISGDDIKLEKDSQVYRECHGRREG